MEKETEKILFSLYNSVCSNHRQVKGSAAVYSYNSAGMCSAFCKCLQILGEDIAWDCPTITRFSDGDQMNRDESEICNVQVCNYIRYGDDVLVENSKVTDKFKKFAERYVQTLMTE